MRNIITRILSILCLVAVLACAFVPCIKFTGDYQSLLGMVNSVTTYIPEESIPMIEEMLGTQGITMDIKGTLDSFTKLLEPLNDGEISIMDCVTISTNCTEVAGQLSALPMEGLNLSPDNPLAESLSGISELITTLAQLGATLAMLSYVFLIPVGLFGILAFFVVLRIILRVFGRRGLGVGITFLAALNAALMLGIPYVVTMYAGESLPFGVVNTNVPYIMVGCALANCIIWVIGRGAKVKKDKEVVAETPSAPVTPVEPTASVEPATEAPVQVAVSVEDVVVEDEVEETVAEDVVEDEVLVDVEVVEEAVEEAAEEETV